MNLTYASPVRVVPSDEQDYERAEQLAGQLALPLSSPAEAKKIQGEMLLCVGQQGLGVRPSGAQVMNPVYVDFLSGANQYRQRHINVGSELIAKAIGVKSLGAPQVIDATAGLGRDAWVLASLGCRVTLLEKNPVVACLLRDGLARADQEPQLQEIVARMQLLEMDAGQYLQQLTQRPEVIYLDPMFPERRKAAKVKKEMQCLQLLVGHLEDGATLLPLALKAATRRVVVKRPRIAPPLAEQTAHQTVLGSTSRFDLYFTT